MLTHSVPLSASVPAGPGIYGWWFADDAVAELKIRPEDTARHGLRAVNRCRETGYALLYIGKAQKQTLAERINKWHLRRTTASTLRVSVAALRGLRRIARDRLASPDMEIELSEWMHKSCRISWEQSDDAGRAETQAFLEAYTPLNLKGCPRNDFRRDLLKLRKVAP
ncbi:GIY-YIG nuclease family protein [Brevundimonas sp.]|uniref:GIY-YIG nuclease family protein n=1 Tax=Brevundimonas sp. TaxID=1871086 RepID=UPI0025E6C675|nr:hypothetical protein [Brevundimonas sp.]